jgi:oligopeptidase B
MSEDLHYPSAQKKPYKITTNGHTRVDEYYWLRDKTNQDVLDYLESENDYTKEILGHTEQLQTQLYEEMKGRIQETDEEVPYRVDDYYYYSRTVEGQQYSIYCRKQGSLDAPEEILLDLNQFEKDYKYIDLGVYKVSPDHQTLAYSLDATGAEDFHVFFKNLQTGEIQSEKITTTGYSGEWANDNQNYFYTTQDHAKRDYRLYRHKLGQSQTEDELIYEEKDELFRLNLTKTRDMKYLELLTKSIETTEIHLIDADQPESELFTISPRQKGLQYKIAHHNGTLFILTNKEDAKNNQIMTAKVEHPGQDHWQTMITHNPEVFLTGLDSFENHLVIYKREKGLKTISVLDLRTQKSHKIQFPEAVYTYEESRNPEFHTNQLRFTYMSMTTPDSVFDYHMDSREMQLRKRKPVLGGFKSEDYETKRTFATAEDGTKIPISLVYHKEIKRDGTNPCLLYGYGSYGYSMDPSFNSNRISLLERGFIYAIAHIRGGQEMGREWYEHGKYLNKKNTFTDFIACGRHLIAEKFTSKDNLAIMGRSAGGLLIGAVLNLAPDLCHTAVAGVPFVDVITTMLDESIPLTVNEFEEWGNPKDKEYYNYMLSYSPYDNVEAKEYPHILVTAGLNDPRVQYWEPAKWLARLRVTKTDHNRLVMKTNMGAGHFGASGRYEYLKEIAFEFAFIIDTILNKTERKK